MNSIFTEDVVGDARAMLQDKGSDSISDIYTLLRRGKTKANLPPGLYPTPQPLARFMVQTLAPQPGETIYDPACGMCSLLVEAYRYLHEHCEEPITNTFLGYDINSYILQIGKMYMKLSDICTHDIHERDILQGQSLFDNENYRDYSEPFKNSYLLLVHPPYEPWKRNRTPKIYYDRQFLRHCMDTLQNYQEGRCAIIVSQNLLISDSNIDAALRRELVDNFNLRMIVRLPENTFGQFAHYSSYMLVFNRQGETSKIVRCNIPERKLARTGEIWSIYDEDFTTILDMWEQWQEQPEMEVESVMTETANIWVQPVDEVRQNEKYTLLALPPNTQQEDSINLEELTNQLVQQGKEFYEMVQQLQRRIKEGV